MTLSFSLISAQETIEYRPTFPKNKKDTIIVFGGENYSLQRTEKAINFYFNDADWGCKRVTFVHFTKKEVKTVTYNNTLYVERVLDEKSFTEKNLLKYEKYNFTRIKEYSLNNKGCYNLEDFLSNPTIYFLIRKDDKYIGYEVLPTVWGIRID